VRHGVHEETRLAAKMREALPVDKAMMDLFTEIMIQKMKDGAGVTFDIDSPNVNEDSFANTLQTRGYEEGTNGDEDKDEEGDGVERK
jgi:hypothetical protein